MKRPPALDTLQAARDITKTGMNDDTAAALVIIINRAVADTAATHFDLREVKTQLEKEREVENAKLRVELAAIRAEMAKSEITVVKQTAAAFGLIIVFFALASQINVIISAMGWIP